MKNKNFLLGYGERLIERIAPPPKFSKKVHPYTFEEARERLLPQLKHLVDEINDLPDGACPGKQTIGIITLHPSYLAKSYYPESLLHSLNLRAVGSRSRRIIPQQVAGKRPPAESITSDLFVAGTKRKFLSWLKELPNWDMNSKKANDFIKIEKLEIFHPKEKIRPSTSKDKIILTEIVLHASKDDDFVLDGFLKYLTSLKLKININKRFYSRGLCFLKLKLSKHLIPEVAKFSFLRVIREMPHLRFFNPVLRSVPSADSFPIIFPTGNPIDSNIKVAVFDGGTVNSTELQPWVKQLETKGIGIAKPDFQKHGTMVTSALLFGSLEKGKIPEKPFAPIDHYRILDRNSGHNMDLVDVLARILDILQHEKYNFINLSIGPNLPIEDNDVHMWTSMLDDQLSNGNVLASIAVGNNGDLDPQSGNARIQVPADCVNALSVGACNTIGDNWKRADYSSIGPGRSPGVIKPDILAFGGTQTEPFWTFDANLKKIAVPTRGTSFAAPTALRMAIGVRAFLGPILNQLALKALLINRADKATHDRIEIGWGRIASSIEDIIVCEDGTVHVVYQGTIASAEWIRASIPIPSKPLTGPVTITATFCFATETDPQDPINYTRSGLEVIFRPNKKNKTSNSLYAKSQSFFKAKEFYPTESELRKNAHKWETTLHASHKLKANKLFEPVFDIHYNARVGGAPNRDLRKIPYALVITIKAPQVPDLYNQVSLKYRTQLEALRPIIEIPIRTREV